MRGRDARRTARVHASRVDRGEALGTVWRRESAKHGELRESPRARSAVVHTVTPSTEQPHTKEDEFP